MTQDKTQSTTAGRDFMLAEKFGIRRQANAIVVLCLRNTRLEDFHAEGYISDEEMKNLSIEACARIEYLMDSNGFSAMPPPAIFDFAFQIPYGGYVEQDLGKPMWRALRKESERQLSLVKPLQSKASAKYKDLLFGMWRMYARCYNEDIKFDGKRLSRNPKTIAVGHQWIRE